MMAEQKFTGRLSHRNYQWKTCDELLKLEAELRNAYTLKMLKTQVAEKNANSLFEEIRQKFEEKLTISNIEAEMKNELENEKKHYLQKCEKYKSELQSQIQLKQEIEKNVREDERKERRLLQEVDRIRDEEEEFEKLKNKYETREKIEKNYLMQMELNEILKKKREDLDKEEDSKIKKYMEVLEQRNLLVKKEEHEKIKKREEAIRLIARMIIDEDSRKQEKEKLIANLVYEEMQCREIMREKEEYLKRLKEKDELMNTLEKQVLFNEECKRHFVERDRDFAKAVMKRILEDERLERCTLEARKRKSIKYREELQKLMEEKKSLRDKQLVQIQQELQFKEQQEAMLQKNIREERISLLKLHMASIAEFVNKNILTKEEQQIFT